MADPYGPSDDPYADADAVSLPGNRPVMMPPAQANIPLAQGFLAQHRAAMEARQPQIADVQQKQQASIDEMTRILDETTSALRASRQGRVNLPMLALGAGMMGPGNFGDQVGRGLANMVPAIQQSRKEEDEFQSNIAGLALKKAQIAQLPMRDQLAYLKAVQLGDLNAIRAIEAQMVRAGPQGAKEGIVEQKNRAKVINDAMGEARKQIDAAGREYYPTDEAYQQAVAERFKQLVQVQRDLGFDIPQDQIDRILQTMKPVETGLGERKSGFNPQHISDADTYKSGLPKKPEGYIYESVGPKDRKDVLTKEQAAWNKLSADFIDDTKTADDLISKADRALRLIEKKPEMLGSQYGVIGGGMIPDFLKSKEGQELNSIFKDLQVHGFPKGQGAVSNGERELFAQGQADMNKGAVPNKNILESMKIAMERDKDRREFLTSYFNRYRTTGDALAEWNKYISSNAGSSYIRDDKGEIVPNRNRMNWREFFRKDRETQGEKYAEGGAVRLGKEYDDG
jgi:hypothetical protein